MAYEAASERYTQMQFRTCGKSGLKLPALSLGLWHNLGDTTPISTQREILRAAFDLGVTHFDLANNLRPAVWQRRNQLRPHLRQSGGGSLKQSHLSEENLAHVRKLNDLAQMALAWALRGGRGQC